MIFYFDRQTGRRVSKSTWTRSHAQGGTRYVRRSTSSGVGRGQPKNLAAGIGASSVERSSLTPSQMPRTYQEWKDYFQKLPKRKRRQIEGYEGYEGPEYETGVDY